MSEEQGVQWLEPPRGLKPRQMARWVRESSGIEYHIYQEFLYTCVVAQITVRIAKDTANKGKLCCLEGVGFAKCAPVDYAIYSPERGYVIAQGRAELALARAILEAQGPTSSLLQAIEGAARAIQAFSDAYVKRPKETQVVSDRVVGYEGC